MSDGKHLVVGSIKFVEGMRTEVLQRLAEMIGGSRLLERSDSIAEDIARG